MGKIRRLKLEGGIDFEETDGQILNDLALKSSVVCLVAFHLYQDHLRDAGYETLEQFEDDCGAEEVTEFRWEVMKQMRSFSDYWRMGYTMMADLLNGNTSPEELLEKAQAARAAASGPSSSPQPQPSVST